MSMVKGVYVLVISVNRNIKINVGALGKVLTKDYMRMSVLLKTV